MNLKQLTIAAGLGWAMAAGAAQAGTFNYSTDGVWVDPEPSGAIATSADGKTISWGGITSQGGQQSSYVFVDAWGMFDVGEQFLLGTFTHNNFPVFPPSLESTGLKLDLTLNGLMSTFNFNFLHDETDNVAPCDPSGATICPDVVSFLDNGVSNEFITIDGVDYNLTLTGFLQNGSLTEQFLTEEGQANTAQLFAKLTVVPTESVPEPMAVLGLLSVGGVATVLKRQKQEA